MREQSTSLQLSFITRHGLQGRMGSRRDMARETAEEKQLLLAPYRQYYQAQDYPEDRYGGNLQLSGSPSSLHRASIHQIQKRRGRREILSLSTKILPFGYYRNLGFPIMPKNIGSEMKLKQITVMP